MCRRFQIQAIHFGLLKLLCKGIVGVGPLSSIDQKLMLRRLKEMEEVVEEQVEVKAVVMAMEVVVKKAMVMEVVEVQVMQVVVKAVVEMEKTIEKSHRMKSLQKLAYSLEKYSRRLYQRKNIKSLKPIRSQNSAISKQFVTSNLPLTSHFNALGASAPKN